MLTSKKPLLKRYAKDHADFEIRLTPGHSTKNVRFTLAQA
jgi:hypothetical protein